MDINALIPFAVEVFFAGVLTFLAPCTLPLVPAYIGFISGASQEELKNPNQASYTRRKIILNGIFFIIGFSVVFIAFGTLLGFIGQFLTVFSIWFSRIGGFLVVIFGLSMMGVFSFSFLKKEYRISTPSFIKIGKPTSSLFMGSIFGIGWTPCVGPILGTVLILASTSSTAIQGGLMLTVFSLGLGIPFLAVAFGFSKATKYIPKISKYSRIIAMIGGVFMILLGILLITDRFSLLISYGYQIFQFIGYDRLLNYL